MPLRSLFPLLALAALSACAEKEVEAEDTGSDDPTDTGDTSTDTVDTGDTTDTSDTVDTADTSDTSDTSDTTDTSDTGNTDPLATDNDGDGLSENDGDCDDTNALISPTAVETTGNGIDENCNGLMATVDMTCHGVDADVDGTQDAVTSVRIVGPWWSWAPDGGPGASDNGDGTWSVLFEDAPTAAMEYLWSINLSAPYEYLIDDMQGGGSCAPITDYNAYANRQWAVGSGNIVDTFASCAPCGG